MKWLYANDSYLKQPYADNLTALIHGLRLRAQPPIVTRFLRRWVSGAEPGVEGNPYDQIFPLQNCIMLFIVRIMRNRYSNDTQLRKI